MLLMCSHPDRRLPHSRLRKFVGDFTGPRRWNVIGSTPLWAADNDAFSQFDKDRYCKMVAKISHFTDHKPVFVTLPDKVGNHEETLRLWYYWHRKLGRLGIPRAFVIQNGIQCRVQSVPWETIEAIFIGGDTDFKLGPAARYFVTLAKTMGKWVHMGRVNSIKRMRYARDIGCDSCDGSGMARFPNRVLLPMLHALEIDELSERTQLNLFPNEGNLSFENPPHAIRP